ncbi:MAG: hypothetical protein D6800_02435 [Candidatus Zixiibacteriota bacterium]|nr:MAG: hypothetical protein D6800_02435 [candidate division Zixibacteria bacterium]
MFEPNRQWMRRVGVALTSAVLIGMLNGGCVRPMFYPSPDDYFVTSPGQELPPDVRGQMQYVREVYYRMANRGDDFEGWPEDFQDRWKYAIAFAAYGLPSAMILDPAHKDEYALLFDNMIWKMKSRRVWGDFTDRGFGSDPISMQNIMYKGHLNLMYGLYQLSTGDTRYAREFVWLSKQIADEMRLHHQGHYEGVTCEPNSWYPECNSIAMLSLYVHDKIYGTHYTENEVRWTLEFMLTKMQDPETRLFYRSYHPHHDIVTKEILGYANAWILTMLHPIAPDIMEDLYQNAFRKHMVLTYGPQFAGIKKDRVYKPERDETAHLLGLLAAKEFGDRKLFGRLRNAADYFGKLRPAEDGLPGLTYRKEGGILANGPILAAKLHVGWTAIFEHDWGYPLPLTPPETDGMTWRDLLPDREYRYNNGDNPLPASTSDRPCPSCYWGDYKTVSMQHSPATTATRPGCGLDSLAE